MYQHQKHLLNDTLPLYFDTDISAELAAKIIDTQLSLRTTGHALEVVPTRTERPS